MKLDQTGPNKAICCLKVPFFRILLGVNGLNDISFSRRTNTVSFFLFFLVFYDQTVPGLPRQTGKQFQPIGVISITPTSKSKNQNDLLKNTASGSCIRVLAVMHAWYT